MLDYVAIPEQIKYKMNTIELTVDVMFVYGIPFVILLDKNMKFTTIEYVVDRKAATLLKTLRSIKSVTQIKIFDKKLFMDNKFEVLRDSFWDKGITPKTTGADKHVPQIER